MLGFANREPIPLTSGPIGWGHPVPSRDGTKIFARGIVLNGELLRYDAAAQRWTPSLGGRSAEFVTFSPDRKSIAYVAFPDEVLYRANLDGTTPVQITDPSITVKSAEWSPDGSLILIDAQVGSGKVQAYVVPAQGGPPKRLIPDDNEPEIDPHWSPDGKQVVYSNWSEALHRDEIRIFDLATHEVTALPGSGEDFSPRWSPDGRSIAALTVSQHKVRIFELAANRWTTLYEKFSNFPVWSSDSKFVYFLGGDSSGPGILRIAVTGEKPEMVAPMKDPGTGSLGAWFGLDPDDSPLYLRDKGTDEIYALTLERD